MRKKLYYATALVVFALAVLIFLSATIYNAAKPSVTAEMPFRGYIEHFEIATGVAQRSFGDEFWLHSRVSGWIDSIFIEEGDTIYQGQILIGMDFRDSVQEIQLRIQNVEAEFRDAMDNLSIERARIRAETRITNLSIQRIQSRLEEMHYYEHSPDTGLVFAIIQNEDDIYRAYVLMTQLKSLFEAGVVAQIEVTTAETNLNDLILHGEYLQRQQENQSEYFYRQQANQIIDLERQVETFRNTLDINQLDMQSFTVAERTLRQNTETILSAYNAILNTFDEFREMKAPVSGIVTNINVKRGQYISDNQLIIEIGIAPSIFVLSEVTLDNTFVYPGDTTRLHNAFRSIEGTVISITPEERGRIVRISIDSEDLIPGETFTVHYEKTSTYSAILVPNAAVGRDGQGHFINVVRRRSGILGNEFYSRRVRVLIGESDAHNTEIVQGITMFEPVIILSDRPFDENQSIRLRNEVDFFGG